MYSYDPEPMLSPLRRLWRHRTRRSSLLLIGCVLSDYATVYCSAPYSYLLYSGRVACVFFQMGEMRRGERHANFCFKHSAKKVRNYFCQFKLDASSAISSCLLFKYAGTCSSWFNGLIHLIQPIFLPILHLATDLGKNEITCRQPFQSLSGQSEVLHHLEKQS